MRSQSGFCGRVADDDEGFTGGAQLVARNYGSELVKKLEAGVEVEGDAATVFGVGAAKFADDAVFEFEFVAVEVIDDEVEGDEFLLVVDVEAVSLEDGGVTSDDFFEALAHGLVGFGLAVFGINTDGEGDVVFREGALRNLAGQAVDVLRGEVVGDLDVDGAHVSAGAVIMEDEVIGAAHLGKTTDEIVKAAGKSRVAAAADDVED